ncbi:MAG: DUF378 domain-containing protein [Paeniclostridium sp.]
MEQNSIGLVIIGALNWGCVALLQLM